MKKRTMAILLALLCSVSTYAGYGWERYVDPKVNLLKVRVERLFHRMKKVETRLAEIEKHKCTCDAEQIEVEDEDGF